MAEPTLEDYINATEEARIDIINTLNSSGNLLKNIPSTTPLTKISPAYLSGLKIDMFFENLTGYNSSSGAATTDNYNIVLPIGTYELIMCGGAGSGADTEESYDAKTWYKAATGGNSAALSAKFVVPTEIANVALKVGGPGRYNNKIKPGLSKANNAWLNNGANSELSGANIKLTSTGGGCATVDSRRYAVAGVSSANIVTEKDNPSIIIYNLKTFNGVAGTAGGASSTGAAISVSAANSALFSLFGNTYGWAGSAKTDGAGINATGGMLSIKRISNIPFNSLEYHYTDWKLNHKIYIPKGRYRIEMIGGAGGSGESRWHSGNRWKHQSATGGNGAYINVDINLDEGDYTVSVGQCGNVVSYGHYDRGVNPAGISGYTTVSSQVASNGTATTLTQYNNTTKVTTTILKAGGGTGAETTYYDGNGDPTAGTGGTTSGDAISNTTKYNTTKNKLINGSNGKYEFTTSNGTPKVTNDTPNTGYGTRYGWGGCRTYYNGEDKLPTGGFVKITKIG